MKHKQGPDNQQQGPGEGRRGTFRFRNYELIRRIDMGGMGEVYLARQRTAFDREVAIKLIRADLVHDVTVRKRFRREAEVNAHIKHGHILSLVEFGEEEGRLFFVTPYIAGGNLSQRLQAGPLSLSEVYQLFKALVEAVAYIHRRGVVHRDLKPSNILLDQERDDGDIYIYLIDFGIASIQGQAAEPPLTTAGTELGTVAYMAPERLFGVAATSNDIFSLGVILYQMFTGQLPAKEQPISVPQPLKYVIDQCMAPLGRRFNSADEVLDAFEYAYQYLNATSPPSPTSPRQALAVAAPEQAEDISPRRPTALRPMGNPKSDVKTLQRSDDLVGGFSQNDYEAPTTNVDVSDLPAGNTSPPTPPFGRPARPHRKHANPLFAIFTLLIVLVLLVMAGLFFFEFQGVAVISARVNFSPQVHTISKVFSIKGSQTQTAVDGNSATIPVKTSAPVSRSGSQTGATSRQCILFICQRLVTQGDVNTIAAQLKQKLDNQLAQIINRQLEIQQGVQIGSIAFTTTSATSNPAVGSESKTVTVSMTEQGQVAYFLTHDAQQLARLLLKQQGHRLGPNFALIDPLTQVGTPVVTGIDGGSGLVFIKIAAGGVAQYQFPASELKDIRAGVKGLKIRDAATFIKQEQGVDPQTVTIQLSAGDTLPADLAQIKIIPVNPGDLPPVQLTAIPTSATPTQ
jgi:serine/threonine protein kinase